MDSLCRRHRLVGPREREREMMDKINVASHSVLSTWQQRQLRDSVRSPVLGDYESRIEMTCINLLNIVRVFLY